MQCQQKKVRGLQLYARIGVIPTRNREQLCKSRAPFDEDRGEVRVKGRGCHLSAGNGPPRTCIGGLLFLQQSDIVVPPLQILYDE